MANVSNPFKIELIASNCLGLIRKSLLIFSIDLETAFNTTSAIFLSHLTQNKTVAKMFVYIFYDVSGFSFTKINSITML